jgi:NitT/TauT family transport system substrate-binding protein
MKALIAAIEEAATYLKTNPLDAAKVYLQIDRSKLDPESLAQMITNSEVIWGATPKNTFKTADFLHKIGRIKSRPSSWKDLFFPGVHDLAGS